MAFTIPLSSGHSPTYFVRLICSADSLDPPFIRARDDLQRVARTDLRHAKMCNNGAPANTPLFAFLAASVGALRRRAAGPKQAPRGTLTQLRERRARERKFVIRNHAFCYPALRFVRGARR